MAKNVAIPEVDVGDNIFVVQGNNGTEHYVGFKLKLPAQYYTNQPLADNFGTNKTTKNITAIPVHYVFIVRHDNTWTQPALVRQDYLFDHFENNNVGSEYESSLNLYFSYRDKKIECSEQDFTKYICY